MTRWLAVALVLGLTPLLPAGDLEQGIALYRQGKYAEAEGALKDMAGAEAKGYLAGSLARQRKYEAAEAAAKAAVAEAPAHEVAVWALGAALVGAKKYDEAVARMSAAIEAKADQAYAYLWRGQAYYNKKQPDKMVGDFQTFLKLAPDAPEADTVRSLLAGLK